MPVHSRLIGAAIALAAALAGCGGTSTSSTTTPPVHSATTAAIVTSTAPAAPKKRPHKRHKHKTQLQANPTTSATVQNAPSPTPAGTPPAPSGLAQATGYGTYELCSSQCAGAVPASLRRSLHLPRVSAGGGCRISAGGGPVHPVGSLHLAVMPFIGSPWKAARVTWVSSGSYTGPVLIRGRRLDGGGAVGFGEGRVPYDELQLLAPGSDAPPAPAGGRSWLSFTRLRGPGCFGYQVDGTSFSTVIVFEASG